MDFGVRGVVGFLAAYYLATPLFAAVDLALGLPVRVAGLERPLHRGIYYVVLVALGLVCRSRPKLAPWVGMAESAGNLFLLLLAILLPVWSGPEAILAGTEPESPFGRVSLFNAILSGSVLIVSFYRNQAAAGAGGPAAPRSGVNPR